MITQCRFCDYQKSTDLSLNILKVLADKNLPKEDYLLWFDRLLKVGGTGDYNSVKIHMGMKHKKQTYKYINPHHFLTPAEATVLTTGAQNE